MGRAMDSKMGWKEWWLSTIPFWAAAVTDGMNKHVGCVENKI